MLTYLIHKFRNVVRDTSVREDEEKASKDQSEDGGAVLVDEESNEQEQVNCEPSSLGADKVLEGQSSDLHEMPDVALEGDELKIGSQQSDIVSEVCPPFPFLLHEIRMCLRCVSAADGTCAVSIMKSSGVAFFHPSLVVTPSSTKELHTCSCYPVICSLFTPANVTT